MSNHLTEQQRYAINQVLIESLPYWVEGGVYQYSRKELFDNLVTALESNEA